MSPLFKNRFPQTLKLLGIYKPSHRSTQNGPTFGTPIRTERETVLYSIALQRQALFYKHGVTSFELSGTKGINRWGRGLTVSRVVRSLVVKTRLCDSTNAATVSLEELINFNP